MRLMRVAVLWGGIFFVLFSCGGKKEVIQTKNMDKPWVTDLEGGLREAKEKGLNALVYFGGSDWCVPCITLHAEVYGQKDFLDYAMDHIELISIDVPREIAQTKPLREQNVDALVRYRIGVYPTTVIVNGDGKEIGRFEGYGEGDSKKLIDFIRQYGKR